jgi:ABC-type sugar transport system permease subunit
MFLIILASRESIPDEYYETAQVYGSNRVQTFLRITLPQLKSAILVALSIRLVWNLAKVSQAFQLTQGGPGYETSVLGVLLYRFAYSDGQFGMGFAVGMFLLAVTRRCIRFGVPRRSSEGSSPCSSVSSRRHARRGPRHEHR